MRLSWHAPFGGAHQQKLGAALRKRFCVGSTMSCRLRLRITASISVLRSSIVSTGDVFHFLTEHTAKELLEQASLASDLQDTLALGCESFATTTAFSKARRFHPQIQRHAWGDLLARVFPQAAACFETIEGVIRSLDHPLVREVMKDVFGRRRWIWRGCSRCFAQCTTVRSSVLPSILLCHHSSRK